MITKVRIIGLLLVLSGIALDYFIDSKEYNFAYGGLLGLGIGLLVIGRFKKPKV